MARQYYAACVQSHPGSWFGPDRLTREMAQQDADNHNGRFNPPHKAGVLDRNE
jgi:arginase family enzyme